MAAISVVIPSRNDAELLAVCLAALAAQTRPADEILVVDNASTDATAQVCEAAGVRRLPELVPGVTAATAAGLDAAGGTLLARLDADSVPPRRWLEQLEGRFDAEPGLAAVTGPGDFYGGGPLAAWVGRNVYIGGYHRVVGLLLGHPPLFGSNFAIRAEAWRRISGRVDRTDPRVHDDLHISYLIEPDMEVRWDPDLRVGVSARPLQSWAGLRRRLAMAYATFRFDFRRQPPLARRRERVRRRRIPRAGTVNPPRRRT